MANFRKLQIGADGYDLAEPDTRQFTANDPASGFHSKQAMNDAINDERYKRDTAYRNAVEALVKNTDPAILGIGQKPAPDNTEQQEGFRQEVTAAFRDPRYKSSATYRKQLEDTISANHDAIEAAAPGRVRVNVGAVTRLVVNMPEEKPCWSPLDDAENKHENDK